jgi:prepilin-type processing-associated H-X9-DG protein
MKLRTVVAIAVLGGLVVAGVMVIPMVSRAHRVAEDDMRLERLLQIRGTTQLFADTRTHGRIGWQSVSEQVRAEQPRFLSPFELGDGTPVSYEVIVPSESNRDVDVSKRVVIRDVVHEKGRPSAALFADGHVAFE